MLEWETKSKFVSWNLHALRKTSAYFKTAEYPVACHRDEAISNSKTKNTAGLAPLDSLLSF